VSELEDKINSVLSDPQQMDKIMGMARSLMGGGSNEPSAPAGMAELFPKELDGAMLSKLSRLMSDGGEKKQERALLEAMKPYMSQKRREKMDKAMKLARLARLAGLAMGEMGGDDD